MEPPARYGSFSAESGGLHYIWRGKGLDLSVPQEISVKIYNPKTELWTSQITTGPPPAGVFDGGCTATESHLCCFGGIGEPMRRSSDLHMLNLKTYQWKKAKLKTCPPLRKNGCGLIEVDEKTLGCFGGYGLGSKQPSSTFIGNPKATDGSGWTNEFHLFDIQKGVWLSSKVMGQIPSPCTFFTFTKVDKYRAVLFGGDQPGYTKVNDVYIFNFRNMEVTKVEQAQGEPWPAERSRHAACCLNFGEDHPLLLVSGGADREDKILGDMWILDVNSGKWKEVTPPAMDPCHLHSITACKLAPGLAEVLMFGGRVKWLDDPIANTTILTFERSLSVNGSLAAEEWTLVDVARNDTRGSSQRLKEKKEKIRQATCPSSVSDRVMTLEQQLQAAEQRAQDAEQKAQIAQRRCEEAEQRVEEAVHQKWNLQDQLEESLHREQLIKQELEGTAKELAAHNTEVWRIPGRDVSTVRKIGTGGWGAVFEGRVKVAVKELHKGINSPHNIEKVHRETRLLAEVRHPNLVQFIGAVFDRSPPLIITELLDMNLRQAYQQSRLRRGERLSIFIDVARALDYLHQRYEPIIHRDVSAPNVLLQRMPNNQWKGKVSDLGSANFLQNAQTMGEGAIVYSPPEVIPQAFALGTEPPPQTVKIDVYSYGIVVCEVTTSRFPSQENYRAMFQQVQRDYPQVCELVVQCTKRDPNDRPSMAEVLVELSNMLPF